MRDQMATLTELSDLYSSAMAFQKQEPQKWIRKNQIVVIQDPETDLLCFCSLEQDPMGRLGLHAYLGMEGLKGYLEQGAAPAPESGKTAFQLLFSELEELEIQDFNQIERISFITDKSQNWPRFRDLKIGFVPELLQGSWQCRFLAQILNQLGQVAKQLQKSPRTFETMRDEVIFCLHTHDGRWQTIKVPFKVFLDQLQEEEFFYHNELEAYRVKRLPNLGMIFELAQFTLPTPIRKNKSARSFYPLVTVAIESYTKQLIFAEITDSTRDSRAQVLEKFAATLVKDLQFKPEYLTTDSPVIMADFADFCQKTGISLQQVPELEASREFIDDMLQIEAEEELEALAFQPSTQHEMDIILESTQNVCRTILSSNLLGSRLVEEAKNIFSSVMELVHLVMFNNFKELPDHWTADNLELACQQILPDILSPDEIKHVHDIVYNYVDIVGEAEMLPNYSEIKERLLKRKEKTTS